MIDYIVIAIILAIVAAAAFYVYKAKKVARNASGVPMVALDAMPKKVTPIVVAANTSINSTSKQNCGSPNRRAAVFWKLYNA